MRSVAGEVAFNSPAASAVLDPEGQVVFGDFSTLYAVQQSGAVVRLAGGGTATTMSEAGIPALSATLSFVRGMDYDPKGRLLYFSNFGSHQILSYSVEDGLLRLVAGSPSGEAGYAGDGGAGPAALLRSPVGLRLSHKTGILYWAERGNNVVRALDLNTGVVRTVAGQGDAGQGGYSGDGGAATAALLDQPNGIAVDEDTGELYVAERGNCVIRVIHADGTIGTLAGAQGVCNTGGDGGPLSAATFESPSDVALDPVSNDLWIIDSASHVLRRIYRSVAVPFIAGVAGTQGTALGTGDGGQAAAAFLSSPYAVTYHAPSKRLLVADSGNNRIRCVYANGTINSVAQQALAALQTVQVAVTGAGAVAAVSSNSTSSSGSSTASAAPTPRPAAASKAISLSLGIVADCVTGSIFVSDVHDNVVRRIDRDGVHSVFAGVEGAGDGYSAGGKAANETQLNGPAALALDRGLRWLFVADAWNHVVRVVRLADNVMVDFAGTPLQDSNSGDDGPALAASISLPWMLALDDVGKRLFVVSRDKSVVRMVTYSADGPGTITSLAGAAGEWGFSGHGGAPWLARLSDPYGIAWHALSETLFIADSNNYYVLSIHMPIGGSIGNLTIWAGNDTSTLKQYAADGAPVTHVSLGFVMGMVAEPLSNALWMADNSNGVIYRVPLDTLTTHTVGGVTELPASTSDSGNPRDVTFRNVYAMASDCYGGVLLVDATGVRHIVGVSGVPARTLCPAGYVCSCGRSPLPCKDPSTFCPRDTTAPFNVSEGYLAELPPVSQWVGPTAGYAKQRACPKGSTCMGGVKTPCPYGSYGLFERQSTVASGCLVCPAGSYQPKLGFGVDASSSGGSALTPCQLCPPGSFGTSAGLRRCSLCPSGTASAAIGANSSSTCRPCPSGTWSLPGGSACFQLQPPDQTTAEGTASLSFERLAVADSGNADYLREGLVIAIAIFLVFSLPLLAVLVKRFTPYSVQAAIANALTKLDSTSLSHPIPVGQSPTKTPTSYGGGVTLLFMGVLVGVAVILIHQFRVANTAVQESLLPVSFADLSSLALVAPALLPGSSSDMQRVVPGLTSGFSIVLHASGEDCKTLRGSTASLFRGQLLHEPFYDAASGAARHTFHCRDCVALAQTKLQFDFESSCSTFVVTAASVGSWGRVAVSSVFVEDSASVEASFALTADVVEDTISGEAHPTYPVHTGGRSARGWRVSGGVTSPRVQSFTAPAAPTTSLLVSLPLEATYIRTILAPRSTVIQLLSSLIGLASILGLAKLTVGFFSGTRCTRRAPVVRPPTAQDATAQILIDAYGRRPLATAAVADASYRRNPLIVTTIAAAARR